jgi:hypothetical protein
MRLRDISFALWLSLGATVAAFAVPISSKDWTFSPGAVQVDAEWLSLTRAEQGTSTGNVQSTKSYSPSEIIKIEFDYVSWGGVGNGADGLAIYLFDAVVPDAGTGGYWYSALGYCRIAGGYIGIGLDEYGNFSQSCEGPADGGQLANSATIRGSQAAKYGIVKNFPIADPLDCEGEKCKTRDEAIVATGIKHVLAYLVPKGNGIGYSVNLAINGKMIISGADYPYAAPAHVKIGVSASNGTYANNHEIRNLQGGGASQCGKTT